jgi:predicted LPLAT superfamily acyltransferase
VLLDKVAMLSGMSDNFTIEHDGYEENLEHLRTKTKGSILLSAHVGNWEIAGHKLERLETKFNILMYDNEIAGMKNYMERVMKEKKFNIIAIKDGGLDHLVELHKVFSNKELLVMHGDRFLPGSETIDKLFLGKIARFPAGPFLLAAKFGVPITVVFSMKEKGTRYHFYARKAIEVKRCRTKEETELAVKEASDKYVSELEQIVKKYPTQWFNFYDFWS